MLLTFLILGFCVVSGDTISNDLKDEDMELRYSKHFVSHLKGLTDGFEDTYSEELKKDQEEIWKLMCGMQDKLHTRMTFYFKNLDKNSQSLTGFLHIFWIVFKILWILIFGFSFCGLIPVMFQLWFVFITISIKILGILIYFFDENLIK
jgi:hypothetical protein